MFDGSARPANEVRRIELSFRVGSQGAAVAGVKTQVPRMRLAVLLAATVRDAIGLAAYAYTRARMQPPLRYASLGLLCLQLL